MLKGTKDGILIDIKDIQDDLVDLESKLANKVFFNRDMKFFIKEDQMGYFDQVSDTLDRHGFKCFVLQPKNPEPRPIVIEEGNIELDQGLSSNQDYMNEETEGEIIDPPKVEEKKQQHKSVSGETLIIRKTLRSGQRIEFKGNVVIIGGTNPGSEVIADGDIFVFGKARGLLHAGANGDRNRSILAIRLDVLQIRIGNVVAKISHKVTKDAQAEKAFVEDEQIVIEECTLYD